MGLIKFSTPNLELLVSGNAYNNAYIEDLMCYSHHNYILERYITNISTKVFCVMHFLFHIKVFYGALQSI